MTRRIARLAPLLALICVAGECAPRRPLPAPLESQPAATAVAGLEKRAGQLVTVEGLAVNSRGRQAVQLEGGQVFLVALESSWPAGVVGRLVRATGLLRAVDVYPAFDTDAQGQPVGPPHIGWIITLEQPHWRLP